MLNYTLIIVKSQMESLENSRIFPKSLFGPGLHRPASFR